MKTIEQQMQELTLQLSLNQVKARVESIINGQEILKNRISKLTEPKQDVIQQILNQQKQK